MGASGGCLICYTAHTVAEDLGSKVMPSEKRLYRNKGSGVQSGAQIQD